MGRLIGILVVIWLLIGLLAAWQRDYFSDARTNCSESGDIVLTVVAGPLNYLGVNPKVKCKDVKLPQPSK
jgi:DNA-binding transcriptional regulator of glucitol operon